MITQLSDEDEDEGVVANLSFKKMGSRKYKVFNLKEIVITKTISLTLKVT